MEAARSYKTPYFYHTIRHHISGCSHCHKNLKSNNSNFFWAVKSSSGFCKVGWGWQPLLSIPISTVPCSSGKLRFGKYLRNEVSVGWIYPWRRYVNRQHMCKSIYHLLYRDCASCRSSSQYVWDWYSCLSLPSYCSNTGAILIPCPFLFLLPFHTSSAHKSQVIQKQAVDAITRIPSTPHRVNHSSLECISLLIYYTDSSHISCVLNTIF